MIVLDFSKDKSQILNSLKSYDEIWIKDILDFLQIWWNDDLFFTSKTSGSTGKSKEIKIKKSHAINSAKATSDYFQFKEGQNALLCMNPKFIGAKMMIVRALLNKMKLYCVEASKFPLENIPLDVHFDFAPMLAIQVFNSIDNPKINNIKKILIGGSKVDRLLRKQILQKDIEFYSSYGMTETISHIAIQEIKPNEDIYSVLPGIEITQDKNSCLVIYAPKLSDQTIYTNDIVEITDRDKLRILGRIDNVINSGGIKLNPEIIEEKLSANIQSEFIISSLEDDELGEKLILIVEGEKEEYTSIDFSMLSKYERPKEVFFLKEFLRNENSKIIRSLTRDLIN